MDKVLVEITVPAIGMTYDTYIPRDSLLSEVLRLTAELVETLSDGKFRAAADTVFCNAENRTIFNINMAVEELGIRNGSRLLMI